MAMGLQRRGFLRLAGAGLLAATASAQTYPSKPIKVLVGVPPGGSTDAIARMLASWLQEDLGQPTIVENRPGANTAVAANALIQSAPDGHTLLVATDALIAGPLITKLPYDPFRDFTAVGSLALSPFVFVVHPSTAIRTVAELVAEAKARPNQLHYGSSGNGGASHLGGEKFKMLTGTAIVHVPYRGAGPALTDALSGQYQLSLWTPLAAAPYVRNGRLRALAVTGPRRTPALPEVPTFAEAGMPDYEHKAWQGVFASAGTPPAIVERLAASIRRMMEQPAIRRKLEEAGTDPFVNTPEEFMRLMRVDSEALARLIKAADIKMD
jgi:tripartite-type tricarboxylate transporter receptor subunit TctC